VDKTRSVSAGQDSGVMDTGMGMGVGMVVLMGGDGVDVVALASTGGGAVDIVGKLAEGGPCQDGLCQSSCEFKDYRKCRRHTSFARASEIRQEGPSASSTNCLSPSHSPSLSIPLLSLSAGSKGTVGNEARGCVV